MQDLREEFNFDLDNSTSWTELLALFKNMGVASLCVIIITPISSGQGTIICTPAALVTVAGMYYKIYAVLIQSYTELYAQAEGIQAPDWVNDCLDDNFTIDFNFIARQKRSIIDMAQNMESLASLVFAYCLMVSIALGLAMLVGLCILLAEICERPC